MVAVGDLKPWGQNPRRNDLAVVEVVKSIERFGFSAPIVANRRTGEIIAGHTRWLAAQRLKLAEVPVRWLDLSAVEQKALALADNRLAEIATWDEQGLADVLRELQAEDASLLASTGFEAGELAHLLALEPLPGDDDDVPELRKSQPAQSVSGVVYELGPHRLLCGDSTAAGVWAQVLLPSELVELVWTDPPYGVAYVGGYDGSDMSLEKRKAKGGSTLAGDDLSEAALGSLLSAALGSLAAVCRPGAPWYVASPPGPLFLQFGMVLHKLKIWRQTLTWVKSAHVLGRQDFHARAEAVFAGDVPVPDTAADPVLYGWRPGAAHTWHGGRKQDTVLAFDRPRKSDLHPTMKPLALVQHCVRLSSAAGAIVGDAFAGSGTTLIAAASERRVARCIELDPWYCDVIRRRWTAWATAQKLEVGLGGLA